MDITGIILAGGKSKRMGKNKALLEIGGVPMIERVSQVLSLHCKEILISGGDSEDYGLQGHRTVPDVYPGCGPLSGLHAGLLAAKSHYCFAAACDIPFIDGSLMQRIISQIEDGYDAVVLKTGQYFEPLFSVYSKDFAKAAEKCLVSGNYKVTAPLSLVRWKAVELDNANTPDLKTSLMNINTPEEYDQAKAIDK